MSLGYPLDAFPTPPVGHGFLVAAGEPLTIDACTFSSQKWAGRAPDGSILIRCFVGSHEPAALALSNEALIGRVRADLERTLGVRTAPSLVEVSRYPGQMPHYTVGHLDRVAAAFDALAATPGLILAGAPYRGVGMPDCIGQARSAAARVVTLLGGGEETPRDAAAGYEPGVQTVALDRIPVGARGRVASVGADHRAELAREGLRAGTDLSVASAAPFGGPLVLRVGRARVALARSVARSVEVSVAGERPKANR